MIKKNFPDNTYETYTCTPTGQRKSVTDSRGVTQYTYDLRNQLTRRTDPDGIFISYTYDETGNRTSVITPTDTTKYTFDPLNRLKTVTDPDNGITTYTYDAVGNQASVTYPNSTIAEYTYNSLNRLTNIFNHKANGDTISCYKYTLGPTGNRTRVIEHKGRTVDYTFDKVYRLIKEQINDPDFGLRTIGYTYDAVGNRLSKTDNSITTNYTYDANDRLLIENSQLETCNYNYDNNGNTISKLGNAENVTYMYDYQNRMTKAETTINGVSNTSIDFTYDVDGIRVQRTVNETQMTNFLVDKNRDYAQVIEERDSNSSLKVSYVYGQDLIRQNRDGSVFYHHYDGQMSTRQLTDASQNITDGYTYDAFGILINKFGATLNEYLYTGEQYDPNVGFYYLRARYYNPGIGRFTTFDPWRGSIYDPVSLHKYLYCGNDPVDFVDWSGSQYASTFTYIEQVEALIILGILTTVATVHLSQQLDLFPRGWDWEEEIRPPEKPPPKPPPPPSGDDYLLWFLYLLIKFGKWIYNIFHNIFR